MLLSKHKRLVTAPVTLVLGLALGLGVASAPAQAAGITRNCSTTNGGCLYYNSASPFNAEFGTPTNVYSMNYSVAGDNYYFKAGGKGSGGAGTNVWNNAGAAANYFSLKSFIVWVNTGYSGASDALAHGTSPRKLKNGTYNNETSLQVS